jgi:hypothetical protein
MHQLPEPNDRVRVPFGGGTAEATVLGVSTLGRWVRVAIDVEGSDEPARSVFDVSEVEPLTHAA